MSPSRMAPFFSGCRRFRRAPCRCRSVRCMQRGTRFRCGAPSFSLISRYGCFCLSNRRGSASCFCCCSRRSGKLRCGRHFRCCCLPCFCAVGTRLRMVACAASSSELAGRCSAELRSWLPATPGFTQPRRGLSVLPQYALEMRREHFGGKLLSALLAFVGRCRVLRHRGQLLPGQPARLQVLARFAGASRGLSLGHASGDDRQRGRTFLRRPADWTGDFRRALRDAR